jgi:hypothetical protein
MTTESTDSRPAVLYDLSDKEQTFRVRTVVAADGSVASLSYQEGEADPREFSGAEITTPAAGDGIRVSVVLDDGGASLVMTTFELILPIVFLGSDVSEEGPFGVMAAGLRIKNFITSTDSIPPAPQQEVEAIQLFARAIAHHPEG